MALLEEQILEAYRHRQIQIKNEEGEDDEALLGDIALRLMLKNELEAAAAMDQTAGTTDGTGTRQKNVHARKMMKIQESSADNP